MNYVQRLKLNVRLYQEKRDYSFLLLYIDQSIPEDRNKVQNNKLNSKLINVERHKSSIKLNFPSLFDDSTLDSEEKALFQSLNFHSIKLHITASKNIISIVCFK